MAERHYRKPTKPAQAPPAVPSTDSRGSNDNPPYPVRTLTKHVKFTKTSLHG